MQAITHKSFDSNNNYENLEFLGDRVLGLVVSKKLFELFPNEKVGSLDKKWASLVNKNKCLEVGNLLNLKEFVITGNSKSSRNIVENKIISDARSVNSNLTFFKNKFKPPLENAIITGVYGSQRILNGKPKWPHYGIDFAAKEGTQIKAMLDGTATMVEKDLFYTGGTLIFDHGHGISTLYMHMQKIYVKKGQKVKQGEVIGTVGSTGRSTGAHLDVRLNWFGTRLDPMTVLNIK